MCQAGCWVYNNDPAVCITCCRFGASIDSQLSAVMEDGPGSVAALTILYLEVRSRPANTAASPCFPLVCLAPMSKPVEHKHW